MKLRKKIAMALVAFLMVTTAQAQWRVGVVLLAVLTTMCSTWINST